MNEIEKIEYRALELETKIAGMKPDLAKTENFQHYGHGYLAALKDVLELLKRPSKDNN